MNVWFGKRWDNDIHRGNPTDTNALKQSKSLIIFVIRERVNSPLAESSSRDTVCGSFCHRICCDPRWISCPSKVIALRRWWGRLGVSTDMIVRLVEAENDDAAKCRWLPSRWIPSGQETGDFVAASCRFRLVRVRNFFQVTAIHLLFGHIKHVLRAICLLKRYMAYIVPINTLDFKMFYVNIYLFCFT